MGRRSHNETIVVDSTTIDYARIPSRNTDTLADRRAGMSARGFAVNASLLFRVPAAPEANVVAVRLRRKGLGDLPVHINMRMPRLATAHGRCTPATAVPCLNLDNNNNPSCIYTATSTQVPAIAMDNACLLLLRLASIWTTTTAHRASTLRHQVKCWQLRMDCAGVLTESRALHRPLHHNINSCYWKLTANDLMLIIFRRPSNSPFFANVHALGSM